MKTPKPREDKTSHRSYTPVISFDSKTHALHLHRNTMVDGKVFKGDDCSIDLGKLPESSRQLVIASFKLAVAYANGNKITSKRVIGKTKDNDGSEANSLVEEFEKLVDRFKQQQGSKPEATLTEGHKADTPKV